ncbi:MAG: adenylate/guanylate cyclase domain-containing protein [Anaerolineales bacterium]|nr:adenylate/guanylate cyclase domain-containing protein [Anaerolineales bacterium]
MYFGVPNAHTNDEIRAADAALAIREIVQNIKAPSIGTIQPDVYCQIGINVGPTFVAEIGEPRGRREYNVLGDTVNTAARLMNYAKKNQIIISEKVKNAIESKYEVISLGEIALKGKKLPMHLFELDKPRPKKK